jgi:hypothetical protein
LNSCVVLLHDIKLFNIINSLCSSCNDLFGGKILKLQLLVSGEPNTVYTSSMSAYCKDEEARTVSKVAPSTSTPSPLAAVQCEVTGIANAALRSP